MKSWQIVTFLLLCLVLASSTACNPFGENGEEISQQLVEVVRGDLTVSISGSGNIQLANEAKLAFGISGRVDKIYVKEGDKVTEGEVLAKLDTGALELALAQAELARDQAKAAIDQAKAAIDQAQVAYLQAKTAVDQAKASLEQAEYNLELIELWGSKNQIDIAELQLKAAKSQLKAAELQLEVAESQFEVVESQLEVAESQFEVAEQGVTQAQKQLDEATIIAPFDGMVAGVDADEGDSVSTARTIIHLIDPSSVELQVEVDEIDIVDVKLEQRAIIEVDALPALQLEGEVSYISLLPKVEAGIITYDVTINLNVPEDSGIKIGMSAIADIILEEQSNILLVPDRAITQDSQGNPVVKVMVDEEIEQRLVMLGISDGFNTEIVDGLNEGDVVVIETKAKPSAPGLF